MDIRLDETREEIEGSHIRRGTSKPDDIRTEMVVPTKIEFLINDTPLLTIGALADTSSEMEAVAGRGLFPPHSLEDAKKTVALIGAGRSRIHGGSQGVSVHITEPMCRNDGTLVRYKCLHDFLYVADTGKKIILGFPFFARYNLGVVPGMPTFMQVPRLVKSKKVLPQNIRCTRLQTHDLIIEFHYSKTRWKMSKCHNTQANSAHHKRSTQREVHTKKDQNCNKQEIFLATDMHQLRLFSSFSLLQSLV